ncbi:MAG TPA: hypothetical protein VHR45_20175 [Thermoanaerobaculia bacterium]|nr:hypothetical protein [Thermoanaerobaculia bacterium]
MKSLMTATAFVLLSLIPALALAHGGGHVMGTVTAVQADHFDVKTADGKVVSVPITKDTKYFRGHNDPATAADVKVDVRVAVHLGKDKTAEEVHLAPK